MFCPSHKTMRLRPPLYGAGPSDGYGGGGGGGSFMLVLLAAVIAIELAIISGVILYYVPTAIDHVSRATKTLSGISEDVTFAVSTLSNIALNITQVTNSIDAASTEVLKTASPLRSLVGELSTSVLALEKALSSDGYFSSLLQLFVSPGSSPPPPISG